MLLYLSGVLVMMLAECSVVMDDIKAQGRGSRHSFNSGASSRVQPWGSSKKKSHRCCLPGTPAVRAKRTLCTRARTEARRMRGMGGGVYPTRSMDVRVRARGGVRHKGVLWR